MYQGHTPQLRPLDQIYHNLYHPGLISKPGYSHELGLRGSALGREAPGSRRSQSSAIKRFSKLHEDFSKQPLILLLREPLSGRRQSQDFSKKHSVETVLLPSSRFNITEPRVHL